MLKNKIIVRKIRNIVILIMAMIVMIGAYRNIGRSRAEDVIEIGVLIQDNYGYLDDEEIILEAKEIENDLYEMELPESVNTKKIEQIVKITLEDSETSQTEEPLQEEITVQEENTNIEDTTEVEENTTQSEDSNSLEIVENKIQLTKEQIENQKINIEVIYGIKILGQDENGELISTTLIEKTEEERAQIEITEETQVLYNKILKYEDKENAKLVEIKGFLPIDAKLQIQEVTQEQITEIFGNKKIDVAYDIKIIREVITQTPTDEANPTAPPEEIIETVEINPEDFGEACEVVIKDAKIQKDSNVYHVKEDNTYEDVNVKENTEENVSFDAHTFSIYAVGPEIEDEGIMSTAFLGADPQNSTTYSKSITVLITSASGTGRICRYAWSTSTRTPSSGWYEYGTPGYDFEVTKSSGTGKFYLHFQTDAELSSYGGPYYLDNTAPGAVTISPTSGWTNTPPKTFALSGGTDSHAGFSKYYWAYVDGSESGYLSDNGMEFFDTQNKQIKVCAIDKAGNWGAYSYAYVQIDPVDPTPGTLTMKYGSSSGSAYTSGAWTNQSVYIAKNNGSDALSGHSSTTYTVVKDGTTLYSNITGAKTLTDQGKYTITVTTKDVAGNSATNTYYVNIDKTAPTSTIEAAATLIQDKTYITKENSFNISITASDTGGSGLKAISALAWAGTSTYGTTASAETVTYDSSTGKYNSSFTFANIVDTNTGTSGNGEGMYYLKSHAYDNAQNRGISELYKIIYDTTAPTISVSTPSCTWRNSALSTTITTIDPTANAYDGNASGLSSSNSYQYYLSNSSTTLNGGSWTNYTSGTAISLNPGVDGEYYLFVKRVTDKAGNTSTTGGTSTTVNSTTYQMFGPYQFDYTKPAITYTHQSLDIDTANKTYTMTFRGTDEHYVSGVLTLDNLTILMQNGQLDGSGNPIVYNLKEEPVTLSFSSEAYTGANGVTGYTYRLTISNLEQLEIKSGLTTADYSGVITVAVPANLLVDAAGNKNNQTTITTGVDIPGGLLTDEVPVDVVDPIWTKTNSSVDEANGTATLTVQGTDTYFDESALATDLIKVYVNGTEVTGVNITFDEGTALNETRVQYGANVTVQYGIQHTISFTGLPTDIEQLKIVIEEGTLVDQSGNENKTTEFILYNYLKWTGLETGPKSGFLGNSSIQRENIANVTFVSSTASANSTKWDASARGDNSILAWYETNANGTLRVYIGSDEQIYANRDSSYLFSYIGYGQNCTTTEVITNLNLLKTSHVTNMKAMFAFTGYRAMTSLNLTGLNTANVTNMREMFNGTGYKNMTSFALPSTFDTFKVTDMSWMFANLGYTKMTTINLANIDTGLVKDMSYMFANCGNNALTSLSLGNQFDTSDVNDMSYMFSGCGPMAMTSLDLGELFDTSNVTNMSHMFYECGYWGLTSFDLGDLFYTNAVTNMNSMFYYFAGYSSLVSLDLGDKFDTTNVMDMTNMFRECGSSSMTSLDLGPAFTNIASANSGFLTETGKSGSCVIYAPEAIYKNINQLKLNTANIPKTPAYIPEGYTHVDGTTMSTGFVIEDNLGNQYVWIEVPRNSAVYDEVGTDINLDSLSGTALITALNNIETELQEYATDYREAGFSDIWYSEAQHGFESADDYNDLKYTMLKSVYENGGFYIGKYETGTATVRNSSSDALTTAVIQQNAYPYNYVTNKQAQEIASGMVSGDYTSSLMFGIQWDLVMKYLETKGATQEELKGTTTGSTNWGNYAESTYNITNTSAKYYTDADGWNDGAYGEKASVAAVLLSTGADRQFSKQGIYDLAGNAFEWTLEQSSNTDMPSTIRSGHYADRGTSRPANSHVGASVTGSSVYTGFRVSLYANVSPENNSDVAIEYTRGTINPKYKPEWTVTGTTITNTETTKKIDITLNGAVNTTNYTANVEGNLTPNDISVFIDNTEITDLLDISLLNSNAPGVTLFGDANCDGKISKEDADAILDYFVAGTLELTEEGLANADVSLDGVVDSRDALSITEYLNGQKVTLSRTRVSVQYQLTLENFEEVRRQAGKLYKEWSGNISLKIGGRGEDESTYTSLALVDAYGNRSMMETDETNGTWVNVEFKDATKSDTNVNGKLFADFIGPDVYYEYSAEDINRTAKTVTVVFSVTDKYYSHEWSTGLTANDLTIMIDGKIPGDIDGDGTLETGETLAITRTLTSSEIKATVDGVANTVIGKQYTLVIKDFEQDELTGGKKYLDYAGIVSVGIPAGKISDESGNTNVAETITIGMNLNVDLPSTAYTKPYLPTGFSHVAGTNLSNGLTIQDGSGNQYVWVEVPKNATVYDEIGIDLDLESLSGDALTTALTNIETELQEYATDYRDASYSDTWYSEAQHGFESADDYNALKYTMLKSVYENGGFYIGKYETGTATVRNSSSDALTTAVIQQNAYPYNYVTNKQAQEIASGMVSGDYTSSLMFGIQWDLVLRYLEEKGVEQDLLLDDSSSWGNYPESTYNITNTSAKYYTDADGWNDGAYGVKTFGEDALLSTGADSQFSKQGIYDLAGNVTEWTLEQGYYISSWGVGRGSDFVSTASSGHRADERSR